MNESHVQEWTVIRDTFDHELMLVDTVIQGRGRDHPLYEEGAQENWWQDGNIDKETGTHGDLESCDIHDTIASPE